MTSESGGDDPPTGRPAGRIHKNRPDLLYNFLLKNLLTNPVLQFIIKTDKTKEENEMTERTYSIEEAIRNGATIEELMEMAGVDFEELEED